jgi:hypothetical protein
MSDIRYFTVDEADRTLPLVRRIVRDIVHDYAEWKERVRGYEYLAGRQQAEESAEQRAARREVEVLAERIEGYIDELASIGCVFKGFEEGLVDFYGRMHDRDVFWCWKLGEPSIEYWHEIDDGYAGRQPIHREPVAEEAG